MKKALSIILAIVLVAVAVLAGVKWNDASKKAGEITSLNEEVAAKVEQITSLEETIAAKTAEIETLTAAAAEKDASIEALNTAAAEKDASIEALNTAAAEKDASIEALTAAAAEKDASIEALTAAAAEKDASIEALNSAAAAAAADDETAAAATAEKIAALEEEVKAAKAQLEALYAGIQSSEVVDVAYLMYADAAWANQYWGTDDGSGVQATKALITGEGDYTVGLNFKGTASGVATDLAFSALGIVNGEKTFPGWYIKINEIRVNGEAIEVGKGYTSSDNGIETRMNIMNEWVAELPEDARSFDGDTSNASPIIVDKTAFASVETVEVDFTFTKKCEDVAYIAFADASWAQQWWHDGAETKVKATEAKITGAGDYTVGLDFTETDTGYATGVAFTGLMIHRGEITFPGYAIKINDIRINGESVAFTKGYTSTDEGLTTRMNVMNEWVSEVPEDARTYNSNKDGISAVIVDKTLFDTEVKTYEIDFTLYDAMAYIMYADAAWANQYWGVDDSAVKATNVNVTGEGEYTVALDFTGVDGGAATDLAFAAVGIANGELQYPGYCMEITSIKVNGEEVAFTEGFTTSDDEVTTRINFYNEWVSELPAAARTSDADLTGVSAIMVDKAAFASVQNVEVTFKFVKGAEPVAAAEETEGMSQAEVDELLAKDYNAYIGVQTASYIFRNEWSDASYGLNSEANPGFFDRLTGWDADGNAVDYGGTFVDAAITGDGTYTVSLTTGEMGFGSDEAYNLLFVSTDFPSALVEEGHVTISDAKVKIGDGKTIDYTEVDFEGDYARLLFVNAYGSTEDIGCTVPGPNTTITVTFTVTGLVR